MSQDAITSHRHNDYVGSDANASRIPGADQARTGHHYEAVFPKENPSEPQRAEEHIPRPTGRDQPPAHTVHPTAQQVNAVRASERQQGRPSETGSLNEPRVGDVLVDPNPWGEERTAVEDTLGGATSADVHRGLGHPGSGMTSQELHHDGQSKRKRNAQGTDQYGHNVEGKIGTQSAHDGHDRTVEDRHLLS